MEHTFSLMCHGIFTVCPGASDTGVWVALSMRGVNA